MSRAALGCVLLLAGCAAGSVPGPLYKEPETITIQLREARTLYATVSLIARDRMAYALALCQANRLLVMECQQIREDARVLQGIDFEIRRRLDSPRAEFDTERVLRILEISAKLLGAAL